MNVALAANEIARSGKVTIPKAAPRFFATVEGSALAKVMRVMEAVVERRNTYPILGTVKLEVSGSFLTVTGTDLDIEATADVDLVDAEGEWSVCVDTRTLARIARLAGAMSVRIAPAADGMVKVILGDGDAEYEIVGLNSESFPHLPGDRGASIERFTNGQFASMLGKVSACISSEETRYYLNGVCWQISKTGRRLVTTDGHRMTICRYVGRDMGEIIESRIIPAKTARLLQRITAGADLAVHSVSVVRDGERVDAAKLDFVLPGLTIRSKLIEGTYPNVDRVIPKPENEKFRLVLRRPEIISAIDRARAVSTAFSSAALRLFGKAGRLAIEHKSADLGAATCPTSTEWPATACEFGFNARFIRELLMACQGDVQLIGIGPRDPFLLSDEDETMLRVLMPMRV